MSMPVYEYLCDGCGPFTAMRPMAECELPLVCPACAREAPRVILTAPHFSCLSPERRLAHATNEQSRHAPQLLSAAKQAHGRGCACCGQKSSRRLKRGSNGAKSFPTSRPWMISH
jgi:putative FmdB family regulatory protein